MKRQRMWVLLIGLLLMVADTASARKWTSNNGKFAIEADLVEVKEGTIKLKKQDGKIITVAVSKLSKADRDHLASLAKTGNKPKATTATEDQSKGDAKVVQADITKLSKATYSGDADTIVAYTHPLIIEGLGGEKKAKSVINIGMKKFKAIGLKLESITFPAEPTFLKTDKNHFAIVPTKNIVSAQGQKIETRSFQFGIRPIGEKKWTYMDGSKISQKNVRSFFPDFPRDYKFPTTSRRKP